MTIAILDPFSGIAGDMMLGALLDVGLSRDWLRALPARLGLEDVEVRIQEVKRGEIVCQKVDFDIPPQPHGRFIGEIRKLVADSGAPERVRELADRAFMAIATAEGALHGEAPERVHLHEVGAVDAILDVVGSIWGLELLGVERVYCGTLGVGDGFVRAAHGVLPVPAPATLKLLEGHRVRSGPEGAGELVTPTGAALVRVLSAGPPPREYVPRRSGYGAGTKDFPDRANALRVVLADAVLPATNGERATLVSLAADIDDMPGEYLAAVADDARAAGALDVVLIATVMKKGRPGTRIEVLVEAADADRLEALLLAESSTIGVRRALVERRALPRSVQTVELLGHPVRLKVVELPGGRTRMKPEFDDVRHVAEATGRSVSDIFRLAVIEGERMSSDRVEHFEHPPTAGA
jgi:uncharacterized protein (TIGR00299 family) protein